jgi:hypothetical protein
MLRADERDDRVGYHDRACVKALEARRLKKDGLEDA